jgi:WD40 repeat protein
MTAMRELTALLIIVFAFLRNPLQVAQPESIPISGNQAVNSQEELRFSPWHLVMALAWSPEGNILVISSGTWVYFYSTHTGEYIQQTEIGSFSPGLDFSPDGRWVALGSRDGKIRLWQIEQAGGNYPQISLEKEILAHPKGVNTVVFNQEGDWLASGGNDAIARLWEVRTGELLNEMIGGTFAIPAIAFYNPSSESANGANDQLAIVNGGVLRLREAISGRFTGTFWSDQPLFRAAISPDGRLLATGDISNGVRVWDVSQAFRTGSDNYPEPVFKNSHSGIAGKPSGLVWAVAFHPGGDMLASAGGDGKIYLWNVQDGKSMDILLGHDAAVTSLAFSPDGKYLVSGSLDATVRFWEIK